VAVLYGSGSGLTAKGDDLWTQGSRGIRGAAEAGDHFGAALAVGDFNHDGYADLAIGVPGENVGKAANAGAVAVLYGSGSGLTAKGDDLWTQGSGGIRGAAEAGDGFGSALAAGDFNH